MNKNIPVANALVASGTSIGSLHSPQVTRELTESMSRDSGKLYMDA